MNGEYARAAVWANDMTLSVLCNEHQWDLVRITANSKDGRYFVVDGLVGSEDSLKFTFKTGKSSAIYWATACLHINWNAQVLTNG